MKKSITAVSVLVLLSMLLSACNLTTPAQTQIPADQINTIAAQTVEALTTQMAPPTAAPTNTPEPATATPQATATLLVPTLNLSPVALATNTLIPLPTSVNSSAECLKVFFLKDVNVSDGTYFKYGEEFKKTWQIQNNGSCTWTTAFHAMAVLDDPADPVIHGDGAIYPKVNIAPGAIWEYSAQLVAPKVSGTYIQYWKMVDDQGNEFGIGGTGGSGWYVKINVSKSGSGAGLTITTKVTSTYGSSVAPGDTIDADIAITVAGLEDDEDQIIKYGLSIDGEPMSGCSGSDTWNGDGTQDFELTGCKIPDDMNDGSFAVRAYIYSPGGSNVATSTAITVDD
jgi:hypothetical protein